MEQYLTGFFALGGTLAGGLVTYFVQARAQRMEDTRHRQKLAHEIALRSWEFWAKRKLEEAEKTRRMVVVPSLNHFLICHLRLSEFLNKTDLSHMSEADIFSALERLARSDDVLNTFFAEELSRRAQKTQCDPEE